MNNYRERIYQHYVKSRNESLAPKSTAGFGSRSALPKKIISRYFPENLSSSILDVGCGHGAFIYFLRAAGYKNVRGVDRSPQQVEEAHRLGVEGVFEGDLLETLKTYGNSVLDVVIAFDVIEHFTKDELFIFVDEVHRVLRPGGRFIVHAPNGESPFVGRIRYGDFTHELAFTSSSITQLFLSSGFAQVICEEDFQPNPGVKGIVRWLLWKSIRFGMRVYLAAETGSPNGIFTQNLIAVATKGE